MDIKPITRQANFEIAVTNDLISKQKIWEKIEKKKLEMDAKKPLWKKKKKIKRISSKEI